MGFLAAVPAVLAAAGSAVASAAPAISAVSGLASGAMSIMGGISQYNQQNAAADAQQQAADYERTNQVNINNYNAGIANQQAKDASAEAAQMEARKRADNERLMGMQRALYGKSGAALYAGSPLAVLGDQAAINEMEALDIRREGRINADNLRSSGNMFNYQANVAGNTPMPYKGNYTGSLLAGIGGGVGQIMNAGADYASRTYKPSAGGNGLDYDKINFMARAR